MYKSRAGSAALKHFNVGKNVKKEASLTLRPHRPVYTGEGDHEQLAEVTAVFLFRPRLISSSARFGLFSRKKARGKWWFPRTFTASYLSFILRTYFLPAIQYLRSHFCRMPSLATQSIQLMQYSPVLLRWGFFMPFVIPSMRTG